VVAASQRLRVAFESRRDFMGEYDENVSRGGIFVATDEDFDVRSRVCVMLELRYCETTLKLEGEVVHRVAPELAKVGATPGVAVQFDLAASELRAKLEPYLAEESATSGVDRVADEDGARRAAPRSRARVPAALSSPNAGGLQIDGRTRNLSASGALVSVDGAAVPEGENVSLTLTNPATGEAMQVEGTVVRRVAREDGDVTAVGVAFDPAAADRSQVDHFVDALQADQHRKRMGGISGEVGELGLASLLQMFGMCAPQGTLTLTKGAEEAVLAFEGGLLRHAQMGAVRGTKALARMLVWTDARFEFEARVDADLHREAPLPLEGALLDATRLVDEASQIERHHFPATATLELCGQPADGELCKLEDALLELAHVGMSVGKILDVIPEPDAEIYAALTSLSERQILRVRKAH